MTKKLTIEIQDNKIKVLVDDVEIGVPWPGASLIDNIYLYSEGNSPKISITFLNLLGGLYEAMHADVIKTIRSSIKALDGLPVNISMNFQLNTDKLFEDVLKEKSNASRRR